MAKIVFVLGAGASRRAGGPLMTDFLDRARDIAVLPKVGEHAEAFRLVFAAIDKLQMVHSKARCVDINNVESVFAAFQMAQLLGTIRDYAPEARDIIAALRSLIAVTVSYALTPTGDPSSWYPPYKEFVEILKAIHPNRSTDAIITFNYDVCLEYWIEELSRQFDYSLQSPKPGTIPVLKLHGSLNWARCSNPQCGAIYELPLDTIRDPSSPRRGHCNSPPESVPVIVPPTWNKATDHIQLATVWQRAAQELRDAEIICVIGYSLPESDYFFRYLYAIGAAMGRPLRKFIVIDPCEDVHQRFKQLLGPGAEGRFQPEKTDFSLAVRRNDVLQKHLNL